MRSKLMDWRKKRKYPENTLKCAAKEIGISVGALSLAERHGVAGPMVRSKIESSTGIAIGEKR